MPRSARNTPGGYCYHVINRGVGRMRLFDDAGDYLAFVRVFGQGLERYTDARLLAYCLMPNHWHLVFWPRRGADTALSQLMRWVGTTHVRRWHEHRHSVGTGPIYQGRFKSFPIQSDEHLLTVCRYVERNALRAGLVERAEDWRWSSLYARREGPAEVAACLADWPVPGGVPRRWLRTVNAALSEKELAALRLCVKRGRPWGSERWVQKTAAKMGLGSTLRGVGRPRKDGS